MVVDFSEPERMNLVGYFIRDLLRNNLSNTRHQVLARRLHGAFLFDASGMEITLDFRGDSIAIHQGGRGKITATVRGDLSTLLDIALGENYLKYLLTGRIKLSGNLFKLLKLIRILRTDR
ncbi:MAG: SCP2 sterol-binding domain-containing protein [bacterium]